MSRHVVAAAPDSKYVIVEPRGGFNRMDDWHDRMDEAVALWFAGASDALVANALSPNPRIARSITG